MGIPQGIQWDPLGKSVGIPPGNECGPLRTSMGLLTRMGSLKEVNGDAFEKINGVPLRKQMFFKGINGDSLRMQRSSRKPRRVLLRNSKVTPSETNDDPLGKPIGDTLKYLTRVF